MSAQSEMKPVSIIPQAESAPEPAPIVNLASAIAKAQGAMKNAVFNRTNPHFKSKYADMSSVLDAIRTPLSENGIAVTQTIEMTDAGSLLLRTTLMHSCGESISSIYPLPSNAKPHEMGSALTYARRYSLAAIVCNASDEDDDGNAAVGAAKEQVKRQNPHKTVPEDVFGPIERDANGQPVVNIQHVEPGEKLTVLQQRPIYQNMQAEIEATRSEIELITLANSQDFIDSFKLIKADWQEILRGEYKKQLDGLRAANVEMV